ncbi:MAG: DUF1573 domain-containing protein [Candidatus Hydrogenedentes bacterium]|nr:DUF1573 domain-containing protein [Candidatus Hydrogenedentota bacterium]
MVTRKSLLFVPLCVACLTVIAFSGCGGSKPQEAPKAAPPAAEAVAAKLAPVTAPSAVDVSAPPAPQPMPVSETPVTAETAPAPAPAPAPEPVSTPAPAAPPAASPAADGAPVISCAEPVFDFGETEEEKIEHGFVLRNNGAGTLEITNVKASCGCTTTKLDTTTLAPGAEVTLAASLSLKGRQGKQHKTINVESNDPASPTLTLTLTGSAVPSIVLSPENINLGRIEDDEPRGATFTIKSNKADLSFEVQSVQVDGISFMEHTITEVTPGREFRVDLNSKGPLPVGLHTGRAVVRTSTLERAVIWVPISMEVVGAVLVRPPQFNLRESEDPADMESQQISISPGRLKEYKIREVVPPLDSVSVEVKDVGNFQYRVAISNMPRSMELNGKEFVIRLDDAANTEVKIPIRVFKTPANRAVLDAQKKAAAAAAAPPQPVNPLPEAARTVVETPPAP